MVIDEDIRQLIMGNSPSTTIKKAAMGRGMRTLRQDGLRQVTLGRTTLEEVMRVTQDDSVVV